MKTCKTGCGKMKAGGSVKKVKKMATGGQALNKARGYAKPQVGGDNVKMGIYGMSNAGTTGPNRTAGYEYKKGGAIKKYPDGGSTAKAAIANTAGSKPVTGQRRDGVSNSNKPGTTAVTKKPTSSAKKTVKPKLQSDEKIMNTSRKIAKGFTDLYNSEVEGMKNSPGYKAYKYVKNAFGYKKGGSVKKLKKAQSGAEVDLDAPPFKTRSSKIGVGVIGSGIVGAATKAIADKVKAKKAAKKATEETKKKETSKAKFGASVPVKASCKKGMVRGADGNCVMSRPKFQKGGSFGMLSVKAGVDNNPNPTAADRIAGAKMKKKIGGSIKRK